MGRELSMNRRRFLGAAAGTAAGAGILGGLKLDSASSARGTLVPQGKRSIILYTVRDRISAAPDDTGVPYGFAQVLARLAEIGYQGIEFAGYNQSTADPGPPDHAGRDPPDPRRQRPHRRRQPRQHPGHDHRRHAGAVRRVHRDGADAGAEVHRHGRRPDRQQLQGRLGRGRRALEHPRRAGRGRRPEAVHAQPRRGVQLPARLGPARRDGAPDALLGHPQAGVLPAGHEPRVRAPGDGHLLGARGPAPVPHVHRRPTAPPRRTSSTPAGSSRRTRTAIRSSTRRTATARPSRPAPAAATSWCRSARATSTSRCSSTTWARRASTTPCTSRTTRPAASADPGRSLRYAAESYAAMAALRG